MSTSPGPDAIDPHSPSVEPALEASASDPLHFKTQLAAIEQVKPGNHWNDPHDTAIEVLTDGLLELGILRGTRKKLISDQSYSRYFMHRTGHWLGMNVHDVGSYNRDGKDRPLEPGMVFTIEPGAYLPGWGGVRIEDDVLVTSDGGAWLTDVPRLM